MFTGTYRVVTQLFKIIWSQSMMCICRQNWFSISSVGQTLYTDTFPGVKHLAFGITLVKLSCLIIKRKFKKDMIYYYQCSNLIMDVWDLLILFIWNLYVCQKYFTSTSSTCYFPSVWGPWYRCQWVFSRVRDLSFQKPRVDVPQMNLILNINNALRWNWRLNCYRFSIQLFLLCIYSVLQ